MTVRNVAGYYLVFRELIRGNEGRRDHWQAAKKLANARRMARRIKANARRKNA
jgi:hypothetical protein